MTELRPCVLVRLLEKKNRSTARYSIAHGAESMDSRTAYYSRSKYFAPDNVHVHVQHNDVDNTEADDLCDQPKVAEPTSSKPDRQFFHAGYWAFLTAVS